MEYFSAFKSIDYNDENIKNITLRANILKDIKKNTTLYQNYIIRDGERPEDIAYKFYDDAKLFWIILLSNDIDDPYHGWPLTASALMEYIENLYGINNIYSVKHYITTENSDLGAGIIVNFGTPFSTPVTNYDYEYTLNEEKRKIKILKVGYLNQLLSEFAGIF